MNIQKAMENGHRNSGYFPINSMVDLSMAKCDSSPEGTPRMELQNATLNSGHRFFFWDVIVYVF